MSVTPGVKEREEREKVNQPRYLHLITQLVAKASNSMKSQIGYPRTPQRPQLTPGLFQTGDHQLACYPLDSQYQERQRRCMSKSDG